MILANDFRRQWADTCEDTLQAVQAVGESGWYVLGKEVAAFESALATLWGCSHAVGVASGLDAIEICLRALGCKPGDKVLTTPISAFATTLAIAKLGAVPVFVDCDEYGLIDLERSNAAVRSDRSIGFFVPVHLYGHSLDLSRLQAMREEYDIKIVEDCAQAILAADVSGARVGTVGQMAATSFYPTKNLGALGDGGAILTDDDGAAAASRMLRDYGQVRKYEHSVPGYNSRLDELHAAILNRAHLPRLRQWTQVRRQIAARYLSGISNPAIRVPGAPPWSQSSWHLFPVCVAPEQKSAFLAYMRGAGVVVAEHYPAPIIDQPAMQSIPHEITGDCSGARRFCQSVVSLPIHPYMTGEETAAVVEACNRWNP
jgi:dTDP-3-amino-3,4,6-trideoxy-alpha-D-glucose transaminase